MRPNFASNRGSALLIVLGLLAFLMISAVAFSISMRTEHSAAAAYRRNLLARELLSTAFADARATLDYALEGQRDDAGFNRDSASTRTVEALAPFKYPGEDRYGRLITSRNSDAFDATSVGDDPIAYLLDGKVLAHVPPYVAYPVYMALEQQPAVNEGVDHLGDGNRYYIDWSAGWKPIKTKIPKLTVDVATAGNTIQEAVVGRMAWAVVNLSDSLDINAVGSASTCRGLGLTASEFAFGITDPAKVSESYALFKENKNTVDDTAVGLHIFCSNADLAQYTARVDVADDLVIESDGISPFSWQDAIANEEDGFYSPFSVYSFWPKSDRKKEDGTRVSSDSDETILSCNDIDEGAVANAASGTGKELADAVNKALGATGTEGDNFISLLHDYLDKDSEPEFVSEAGDQWANAQPTVERVPMLTEVAYDAEGWGKDGDISNKIKKAFEEAFKGLAPKGETATFTRIEDIPSHFGDQKVTIDLPELSQQIGLRSYFPGGKASTGNFSFKPEGFAGVIAAAAKGNKEIPVEKGVDKGDLKVNGGLDVDGGAETIFRSTGLAPNISMSTEKFSIEFKGTELPVANLEKSAPDTAEAMEVDLLVDFFFRVPCKQGSAVVDLCPAAINTNERNKAGYPVDLNKRVTLSNISELDAQYFRITRPVKVTFTLQWKITEEAAGTDGQKTYTAKLDEQELKVEVSIDMGETLKMGSIEFAKAGDDKASYQSLSPDVGTWFAIDPRYNWLSPMFGVSDDPSAYTGTNGGNYRKNFSSPHWIFQGGSGELTSGDNNPSPIQQDYAEAEVHKSLVPFTWGLAVEDIRYGYNDAGQLLLPAELAFLPVPYDSNVWSTSKRYLSNSLSNYHERVAKASFFRTLPVVDLKDGAMDYTKYTKLASLLRGFGGENFPEEHRGIVNAFAAQDNYLLHQRLKQFALLGIPPTIKQAAYVTYQRLKAAATVKRIASGMVNEDLKTLQNLSPEFPLTSEEAKPKYDEFVTKYLFRLPDTSSGGLTTATDWAQKQKLYEKQGSPVSGTPTRPKTLDFIVQDDPNGSFAERLMAYNATKGSSDKLGQNDMTTLLAIAKESFGDRQQLFLFILRADFIAYNSARELSAHKPLSTARAVALVWRDAYGELPDRVVYYQLIP